MLTAKEYVEARIREYQRHASRCRAQIETSDSAIKRADCAGRANVWEMCAEEMDNVLSLLEMEGDEITYE